MHSQYACDSPSLALPDVPSAHGHEHVRPYLADRLIRFYRHVDRRRFALACRFLHRRVIYTRGDLVLQGHQAVLRFYRKDRELVGHHVLHQVSPLLTDQSIVVVVGEFHGATLIRFADFWYFDSDGLAARRASYFGHGIFASTPSQSGSQDGQGH